MEPDILLMSPITSFYATTSLHSEGSQSLNEETLEIYKTKLRLPGSRVFVLDLKMGQQAVIELDEQGNEVSYDNRSGAIDRSYKRLIAAKVIGFAIPPRFSVQPPGAGSDNNEEVVVDNLYELAKEAGYNSNEDLNQLARWAGIDPPRETGVKGDILRRVRLMADIYRYIEKQILLEYEAS